MRRPSALTCVLAAAFGAASAASMHTLPAGAQEAAPATVVLVFDGSGSMWGTSEGDRRNKLTLAREAVKGGLAELGQEVRLGLISFGHRRAGDCSDVELIQKPEPGSAAGIAGALDKLNPRGRGPLTGALLEAARHLPAQPAPASVILIHDDYDNCQLDPCQAIADLRRANAKVAVHVVSLLPKREDAQRLQCLAKATGGRLWEAYTASQITTAVTEALRVAGAAVPEPRTLRPMPPEASAPPPQPALQSRPGLAVRASLAEGGEPVRAQVRWRVARLGDAAPVWEGDAAEQLMSLPNGRYEVEAWLGFVRAKATVDVVAGTAQQLTVVLGAGLLRMPQGPPETAPADVRRTAAEAIVALKRIDANGETIALQRGLAPEIALTPGNYVVAVTAGAARFERTVGIRAGQATEFDAAIGFGAAEITAVAHADGPQTGGTLVALYEDDPEAPHGRREVWRSAASPATALLPAGSYYLVARRGTAETRERITIKPGELERRRVVLELSRLTVLARVAGGRLEPSETVTHRLERLDGDREVALSSEPQATFHVAAGRYRIETRVGLANAVVQREVELKAGAREQLSLELQAGVVRLRWLEQANGAALPDVAWEVRDAAGRVVWTSSQTEARPLLLAGRYTVRAEARERRLERQIDVRAGEARAMDLVQ